jgi:thiamine pyrophosphate-dependent acetolactate synthase large subunit-like protein
LDFPSNVLFGTVDEADVVWPTIPATGHRSRPAGDPWLVAQAINLLAAAERPVVISGSGILWSDAAAAVADLIEHTGMPLYTTPQGRGVVPEDHRFFYANARSKALREADVVLVVGTRLNYVFGHGQAPRFSPTVRLIRIDIDPAEIADTPQVEVGIVGDARAVIEQLTKSIPGQITAERYAPWRELLAAVEREKAPKAEQELCTDQVPIHPLRLCKEIRDFLPRDAILAVDGQEILNYGRQSTYVPRHRLNSGPFGTMGVGLPFGLGAKVAKPDAMVLLLHCDGSFGMCARISVPAFQRVPPTLVSQRCCEKTA